MRTLTTNEYKLISQIYNSTDENEANLSFEFGLMNDTYYQLFHSYTETKSVLEYEPKFDTYLDKEFN